MSKKVTPCSHRGVQQRDARRLVDGLAIGMAEPHAAEAEGRNLEAAVSECALLHGESPSVRSNVGAPAAGNGLTLVPAGSRLDAQQSLDRAPLVHGAVAFGHVRERQRQVEDLARD